MKKILILICGVSAFMPSCKKSFLDVPVQGPSTSNDTLYNYQGVQQLLVGAYHDLTGMDTKSTWWATAGTNWIYGDITSGDTYVGGTSGGGLPMASRMPCSSRISRRFRQQVLWMINGSQTMTALPAQMRLSALLQKRRT
jgi:hypothetical protein